VNLSTGWTSLNAALKDMRILWEQIRADWDDPVSKDFEENHWAPVELQCVATLRAIDRLTPVLAKAQRECS
jgi:hypothetical protein